MLKQGWPLILVLDFLGTPEKYIYFLLIQFKKHNNKKIYDCNTKKKLNMLPNMSNEIFLKVSLGGWTVTVSPVS